MMSARIHLDSLPTPDLPPGLLGHTFPMTGDYVTDPRGFTSDTREVADVNSATEVVRKFYEDGPDQFQRKLMRRGYVDFLVEGQARDFSFCITRLTLYLTREGVVTGGKFG